MSDNSAKILRQLVSAERIKEIDHWIAKYPMEQKQSAVMSALRIAQEEHGYLTNELMDAIADYLDMPPIAVYEVASFYTMYEHKQVGRHLINVCTNISCMLCDSAAVVKHLEKKLDIKLGETTDDGRFTLRAVECLGACVNAPMMQVNKDYHEKLTPESIDKVLEQYQ
ncbi:NADH-quinone oxidoreductase subunit NuoE [Legionella longbeachae]|uniref:NADH-quinone oxidoreductase subunit E n=1 Tax=Legionella longbeachae serogroup 1 (strain NSW150) TaxID=661367 RepID=D3HNZ6_LEGLN|nr:NADH-quinone oxidoreductase subunit NuoE [Legionella longbeachae]VEE01136.1 NADH dehydrogenase I chain E [Legionella oakridgensis]HBD7398423.1 NADH-quinone oxidoreductase subunit NuoE [Legionella pneumophila]ARB92487.1 NADH-quinone oxidoreductase subunit NuoE [Legionella longbeachae]ARM34333.1 NADH-quinone oxidoreductase subunit NuoE [Legionella longbeachae]EEZ96389.1 NADH-quinone oxidoreductase E subunit [Legionella longbeachae D-4968]